MEGSGSDAIYNSIALQTSSEMTSSHVTSTHNATDVQLTCEQIAGQFGEPLPIPTNVEIALRYAQVVYYIIMFVVGVMINTFMVVLSPCFKKLQNVTFLLGLQVCVGDMINAIITLPTSTANAIANRFVFGSLCSVFGFAHFSLSLARIYLMFVLVLDRFCNVFMPFWYQRHRNKMVLCLSLGAWLLAFVIGLIPIKGILDCYSVVRTGWVCYPHQGCKFPGICLAFTWTALLLTNFSSTSVVSIVLYFILFCKAKKLRNQVGIAPQPDLITEEERSAIIHISKRERKANFTLLLLFLALIGITLPPVIISFISRVIIGKTNLPTAYAIVEILAGSLMFPLLTLIDPLVITRNEDFSEVIKTMLAKLAKSCNWKGSRSAQ